jgi:hypothetical protein
MSVHSLDWRPPEIVGIVQLGNACQAATNKRQKQHLINVTFVTQLGNSCQAGSTAASENTVFPYTKTMMLISNDDSDEGNDVYQLISNCWWAERCTAVRQHSNNYFKTQISSQDLSVLKGGAQNTSEKMALGGLLAYDLGFRLILSRMQPGRLACCLAAADTPVSRGAQTCTCHGGGPPEILDFLAPSVFLSSRWLRVEANCRHTSTTTNLKQVVACIAVTLCISGLS